MALKNKIHDVERVSFVQRTSQRSVQHAHEHQRPFTPAAVAWQRASSLDASRLKPADVLALQRSIGNHAVQRMLFDVARPQPRHLTIQAKLAVGPANDHYEREADRVAAIVMQTSEPSVARVQRQHSEEDDQEKAIQTKPLVSSITPLIQRQKNPDDEDKETNVQRQSDGAQPGVNSGVERGIESARGNGLPLPGNLRTRMERSFGADFSGVRVHADTAADSLNRSVHARAFTTGHDLFFRSGEYRPESRSGQQLIAHELTHVIQQSGSGIRAHGLLLQRNGDDGLPSLIQTDRRLWKTFSWKEKLAAVIAAPLIAPFAHMWESGKEVAVDAYTTLGKSPGFLGGLGAILQISLGTLIGGADGLVGGALRGLAFGIGNPLYSAGKRLARGLVGIVAAPGVVWDFLKSLSSKGVKEAVQAARGYFDIDTTHPKYGNLSAEERQRRFFQFGSASARRENYNRDQLSDLANYTLQLTGGTTSVTKFLTGPAVASLLPGLEASSAALSHMGAVGGVLGAATSLWDARKGYQQWQDRSNTTEQQRIGLGRGLSGVASATQQTATATSNIGQLVNPAVSATAQVVSGAAALVTGTVDIVRGVYGRSKAAENIERLKRLKHEASHEDIRQAAAQAQTTQEIRRSTANWTIGKGVLGVAGGGLLMAVAGGLLAASMATPIGWGILAGAAVVGAAGAFFKWLSKRKRKKEVAMRELDVGEDQMTAWEREKKKIEGDHWWRWNRERVAGLERLGPDPLQKRLNHFGFRSVSHFYASYIDYTANKLYDAGVGGRAALVLQIAADLDDRTARLMHARQVAVLASSEAEELQSRLRELEWRQIASERLAFNQKAGMNYEQLKKAFGVVAADGNLYPEVEELLTWIGLKFDFRRRPAEPKPEKIGKALHE